ncbi:acetyl-CoA synthetase-like protein [Coemansia reversa NRRL 1564]|uniref:Acetyl-CoA synthetase-like protein n=1 Tax=Coemansia reversa (strain ATCC 12441 / NRRL 1564) TaxID=763665 RepID=A0A2G5BB06_COERN|nr:acetyl-CoA synthetase-like protein [Coemansia reversa NRRL 1564]|eukprot:PIA15897.1 acetyl-CoA synthetase-like protein [Coemansia reversa NRRL 1564]
MKSTSPFPPLEIPQLDLPTFMFSYAKQHTVYGRNPELAAIVDKAQSLSFSDLESQTEAFAAGLYNRLGFRKGDVLATILPNSMMYPVAVMGTHMVGGVVTTANPAYNARELAYQLKETNPTVVVTLQSSIPIVKKALGIAGISVSGTCILTTDGGRNNMRRVFSSQGFPRVYLRTKEEASTTHAFIVFSSGTSGKPKGVVLSHQNMVSNALQFLCIEKFDVELRNATNHMLQRRWLQVLPMFHIYGIMISNMCILSGAVMVIMDKFDFGGFCSLIEEHRIDTVYVAPPILLALVKSPVAKRYDLSSLVLLTSGAAPLSKELQTEARQKLGIFVTQGYGMSETSPLVTRSLCNNSAPGSAGKLCPDTEAVFLDDDGKQVGKGQVGELCVRGPQIMIGYLNNKKATKEMLSSTGLLHTGDIGYIDADDNLFITDRKKELVKYKGFQIPPAELEGLLTDHPAVVDAAVIPVYDESQATEIPKAFVALAAGTRRDGLEKELCAWIEARVVDYKKLRGGVEVMDAIPKSATGKILRRVLKDLETNRLKNKSKI